MSRRNNANSAFPAHHPSSTAPTASSSTTTDPTPSTATPLNSSSINAPIGTSRRTAAISVPLPSQFPPSSLPSQYSLATQASQSQTTKIHSQTPSKPSSFNASLTYSQRLHKTDSQLPFSLNFDTQPDPTDFNFDDDVSSHPLKSTSASRSKQSAAELAHDTASNADESRQPPTKTPAKSHRKVQFDSDDKVHSDESSFEQTSKTPKKAKKTKSKANHEDSDSDSGPTTSRSPHSRATTSSKLKDKPHSKRKDEKDGDTTGNNESLDLDSQPDPEEHPDASAHYDYRTNMTLFELLQTKRRSKSRRGQSSSTLDELNESAALMPSNTTTMHDDAPLTGKSPNSSFEALPSSRSSSHPLKPSVTTTTTSFDDIDDDDDIFRAKRPLPSAFIDDTDDLFSEDEPPQPAFRNPQLTQQSSSTVGPSMKIIDGNIVLDTETLYVESEQQALVVRDTSSLKITARSFRRIKEHEKPIIATWSVEEIRLLHNLLATPVIGYNSLLLLPYFPSKSLKQIKNRLKMENSTHGAMLNNLLVQNRPVKLGRLQSRIHQMPLVDAVHLDEVRKHRLLEEEMHNRLLLEKKGQLAEQIEMQSNQLTNESTPIPTTTLPISTAPPIQTAMFSSFGDDDHDFLSMKSLSSLNQNYTESLPKQQTDNEETSQRATQGLIPQSGPDPKAEQSEGGEISSARRSRPAAPKLSAPTRRR